MRIIDFNHTHIAAASALALANYEEERKYVSALPPIDSFPDLTWLADNGLGVAIFEGSSLVGFLCGAGVWENAWEITGVNHIFSPMGANGTIREGRAQIYAAMYQAVAEKWVRAGAASHGISLYAHDKEAQEQFFRYGFGMRCIDAIRGIDEIDVSECEGYEFSELKTKEVPEIFPLENEQLESYLDSPFFMYREKESEAGYLQNFNHDSVYFIARFEGKIVAYIMASHDGETFIKDTPGYIHAGGAYCLPEFRRKGISRQLLNMLVKKLKSQGYAHLGVDFESFNPLGAGFWLKYFTAYTHSVVRRIDESVFEGKAIRPWGSGC